MGTTTVFHQESRERAETLRNGETAYEQALRLRGERVVRADEDEVARQEVALAEQMAREDAGDDDGQPEPDALAAQAAMLRRRGITPAAPEGEPDAEAAYAAMVQRKTAGPQPRAPRPARAAREPGVPDVDPSSSAGDDDVFMSADDPNAAAAASFQARMNKKGR